MRTVMNISLPPNLTKEVAKAIKKQRYASKSEFFRHLLREWLAGRLALELEEDRQEFRSGKAKILRSMKDLW
ncbi:MAG: ribbon-helix-helix domain-containing protein [Patescibacteria group bacterium]